MEIARGRALSNYHAVSKRANPFGLTVQGEKASDLHAPGRGPASRCVTIPAHSAAEREAMLTRHVTPLLGLALLWPVAAGAGEDWPPYFVGEVVVAGESDDPAAGTGTVTVLEAEDIRKLGAATVAEALQHLAGA